MKVLYSRILIMSLLGCLFYPNTLNAQTNCNGNNWVLPCNKSNTRFTSDHFDIPRPALSLRGFDNTDNDQFSHSLDSKTFGVRQLLEKVYGVNSVSKDDYSYNLLIFHIDKVNNQPFRTDDSGNREFNGTILESLSLLTLLSYIIEENKGTGQILDNEIIPGLLSHSSYRSSLIQELENRNNFIRDVSETEAFKRGNSLVRLARAWDLYLALENAYEDLGGNLNLLLDSSDKQFWNNEIYRGIKKIWKDTHGDVVSIFTGFQYHEVQPGNWPLIGQVSAGIAALGYNGNFSLFTDDDGMIINNPDFIYRRALKASDYSYWDTNNKRYNYWWYQTGGGEAYWAEGPYYFEITLAPILEFLHVYRSNNLGVIENDSFYSLSVTDPFSSDKFLNAVEWLYKIATPDGNTPPIDDGNKRSILSSGLLSWSSSYGRGDIGSKYAHIRDLDEISSQLENEAINYSRLVEIAYEHVQEDGGTPFPEYYGNEGVNQTSAHQLILRKTDSSNNTHYILMNGERGSAITRSEGHEQVDQLQILYYIDYPNSKEVSYLMDSGYDQGGAFVNSTWNQYRLHNVLYYANAPDGGYNAPNLVIALGEKVSDHPDVDHLYFNKYSKITHFYGQFPIEHFSSIGQLIYTSKYRRNLIFIEEDPNNQTPSYIIDANADEVYPWQLSTTERLRNNIGIKYFSDKTAMEADWESNRHQFLRFGSGDNVLWAFLDGVEAAVPNNLYTVQDGLDIKLREENGRDVGSNNKNGYYASSFGMYFNNIESRSWTSVAFLQEDDFSNGRPSSPVQQIDYDALYGSDFIQRSHQIWAYQHSSNLVDIYIKRAKPTNAPRDNSLPFQLSSYNNQKFTLDGGAEFGFARLEKENGLWKVDPNYKINLSQPGYFYTASGSIGTYTYPTGSKIYIADNVTVTFTGTANLNNAEVYLGKDAKIEVRNGGKLITNGQTLFTRLNALEEHDGIRLYTSNNQIENTKFEGGSYGLYMGSNSDNNTIEGSVFEGNQYGIYAYNSDNAVIKGSTFEDSDVAGIWAIYSSLDIDPNVTSETQTRTTVKNSSGYGIVASNGSNVSVRNTTLTNITKHEFMVYSSGRMDLGYHSSGNTDHGKNVLSDAPNSTSDPVFYRYVYSTALTGSGETATQWQVPARKNFWHDGDAPSWVDFYGSVDYSNHLTSLPTGAAKVIAFNNVESAETGQNKLKQGYSNTQVDNSIRFSQSIQELKEEIASLHYDPRIAKLIFSYSGMIDASDKELMKEEIRELRQLKRRWLARYQYVNNMAITDSLTTDISEPDMNELNTSVPDTGLVHRIAAVQTIGEVMLALEMRTAIDNENFGRVFKLVKEYDGRVRGKDLKFELISYLIKASIETQRNDLALRLIDRLELMEPEDALLEDWIPLDFTSLRSDITDQGRAKGVSFGDDDQLAQVFESDIYLDLGEYHEEKVSEFKLYPAYPNPFNPSTTLSFDLPEQGKVRVEVFNISGRLVSILANQNYQQGNHRLVFDASGLASGVYFVRANIAGNIQTQRITLIK